MTFSRALLVSILMAAPTVEAAISSNHPITYRCNQSYGRADDKFNILEKTVKQVEDVTVISSSNNFTYEGGLDSPDLEPTRMAGYMAAIYGGVKFVKIDTPESGVMFAMVDHREHVAVQAFNCKIEN